MSAARAITRGAPIHATKNENAKERLAAVSRLVPAFFGGVPGLHESAELVSTDEKREGMEEWRENR
jgi:hypothetical protein